MGPYATGAILSAMGVAQRYNKVLVHHTFGIPSLAKYDTQFPTWSLGPDPARRRSRTRVLDALAASPKPPKTIAIVTSKFPSVHFMSLGAREVAKKRGLNEVLFLEWDFGNRDYGPIAARDQGRQARLPLGRRDRARGQPAARGDEEDRLRAAGALLHVSGAGADGASRPMAKNALRRRSSRSIRRSPTTRARRSSSSSSTSARRRPGMPDTAVETQAAASYTAWQVLEAAVTRDEEPRRQGARATGCSKNQVDTIQGKLRFDGPSNYGDDLMRVKQVQNGRWVAVWPKAVAAPGATLLMPSSARGAMTLPERDAARAVGAVRRLHRRLYGLLGLGLEPVVGAAAPDQPRALRARVPRRVPLLPARDRRRASTRCVTLALIVPAVLRARRRDAVAARALRGQRRSTRCW